MSNLCKDLVLQISRLVTTVVMRCASCAPQIALTDSSGTHACAFPSRGAYSIHKQQSADFDVCCATAGCKVASPEFSNMVVSMPPQAGCLIKPASTGVLAWILQHHSNHSSFQLGDVWMLPALASFCCVLR